MPSFATDQLISQNVGAYQIIRPLGHGTLSAVYEAHDENTQQTCILTMFLVPEAFPAQARRHFLARFARESAVLMKLQHRYMLPVQNVGEYVGMPYLVNPSVKGSSVATLLKKKGRLTPEQVSELLKRIADSIDYAHSNGVVHGTLSPANILLNDTVQIAGFGLMTMLSLRGLEGVGEHQQVVSRSIAGTTLGAPGYIAPEVLQGKAFDGRIDVYALGILLLHLLYGSSPFSGTNISATTFMQAPRLTTLCPELPASLDAVIQQAVNPDPQQRIQSAGSLATLFAQALNVQQPTAPLPVTMKKVMPDPQITLPNAVDWFVKEDTPTGKWQLIPPITARTAAIRATNTQGGIPAQNKSILPDDDIESIDPFVWWSSMTASQVAEQVPGTFTKTTQRLPNSKKRVAAQKQSRRRVVAMLAGGSVVALGALGFGGVTLAHVLQHPQSATTSTGQQSVVPTSAPTHKTGSGTQAKPTATAKPKPTVQPTQAPKATPTSGTVVQPTAPTQPTTPPTQPPTPTAPPQHTGTVIGSTNMGTNSSQDFTNPADGNGSILIHLPNGNFVAYSKACTHAGVPVYYDGGSQKLKCPAHGAVFDPTNGGSPVSGPNNGPLQNVAIRVNGDGTITTG